MKITERELFNNAKRLKSLIRRPYLALNELSGDYKGSPLRMIVADDGSTLAYARSIVFPEGADVRERGKMAAVLAPQLADADVDIVCVGANQFLLGLYRRRGFKLVPKWVRLYLPVQDHPDVMLTQLTGGSGGTLRRMVRKMKQTGFDYHLTNDPSWFDMFYSEMYRPYVLSRYGALAVFDSHRKMEACFRRGGGLVVEKGGEQMGAAIIFRTGSTLWFHRIGMIDRGDKCTRECVSTAMYYYTLLYAYSSGCAGVDFGHCRPLASDGALWYKLRWGMRVLDEDDSIGTFAIATPGRSEVAEQFLQDNQFYEFTRKGIRLPDES